MEIQKFIYGNSNLDVVLDSNNEPLFYGKEVAAILGYKDTDSAIRYHVFPEDRLEIKDFKDPGMIPGIHHPRQNLIREPGLYALIFGSKKPQAIEFKRWVFGKVLPQIHRTGSYSLNTGLLKLRDISEEDIKNMDPVQKKEFKGELKKFAELLKDPTKQEKGSRGGNALWRKIKEKEELYEELQKKFAAISLILGD